MKNKSPFYLRWLAKIIVRHMAKSNVVTYECQGTLNWKDESGIHNVNASAEDIYGWILNSVGEESRPFLVKEKYIDRSNHLTAQALERSKG